MHSPKPKNLGATSLRSRRRNSDPMQAFDALPAPLRSWLAQAALPWSPASAKRVWSRARSKGLCVDSALQTLARVETQTLARDSQAISHQINRSS